MTEQAFQEEGEAVGKWRRARVTSGQLSTYSYGFCEFMKLREKAERAPGFSERLFHDKLLAYGAPPMHDLEMLLRAGPLGQGHKRRCASAASTVRSSR